MKLPMTYEELRKQMLDEEGAKYPGKALVNMELEPGYNRVIIPGLSEPPVRTLRATIPENESHIFR